MEIKKTQKSWFHTEVDFEDSFKWWFALQWQNNYIQLFVIFFGILIFQLCNIGKVWRLLMDVYNEGIGTGLFMTPFMFIPIGGVLIISYKGFWQFYNDKKNKTSR
jgi:hypothetical protein